MIEVHKIDGERWHTHDSWIIIIALEAVIIIGSKSWQQSGLYGHVSHVRQWDIVFILHLFYKSFLSQILALILLFLKSLFLTYGSFLSQYRTRILSNSRIYMHTWLFGIIKLKYSLALQSYWCNKRFVRKRLYIVNRPPNRPRCLKVKRSFFQHAVEIQYTSIEQ